MFSMGVCFSLKLNINGILFVKWVLTNEKVIKLKIVYIKVKPHIYSSMV